MGELRLHQIYSAFPQSWSDHFAELDLNITALKNTDSRGNYDESHFVSLFLFPASKFWVFHGNRISPFSLPSSSPPWSGNEGLFQAFPKGGLVPSCQADVSTGSPLPGPYLREAAPYPCPGCGGSSSEWKRWGWREGTSHGDPGRKTQHSSGGNPAARAQQALQLSLRREALLSVP